MNLKLLDTGYVSTETLASQTQLGDSNRAGYTGTAVSAITLNVESVELNKEANIENNPLIDNLDDIKTTLLSTNIRTIAVSFVLKKEIITSGWDKNNIVQLSKMEKTKGLKLLYPSIITDTIKNLVEALGAENTSGIFSSASPSEDNGTVSATTPYLVGRVKNFRLSDNATGNYWRGSFDFEISG